MNKIFLKNHKLKTNKEKWTKNKKYTCLKENFNPAKYLLMHMNYQNNVGWESVQSVINLKMYIKLKDLEYKCVLTAKLKINQNKFIVCSNLSIK